MGSSELLRDRVFGGAGNAPPIGLGAARAESVRNLGLFSGGMQKSDRSGHRPRPRRILPDREGTRMTMDALLIATGFTGALTFAWLLRLAVQFIRPAPSVSVSFAPAGGCGDVLVREIGTAQREVLVLAGQLANRPVAQALVDARMRGAAVEVILDQASERDPQSDLSFLTEQGLTPMTAGKPGLHHQFVLIDGKTLLLASFPLTSR